MQDIYMGPDGVHWIGQWLQERNPRRVLMLTGRHSFENSSYKNDLSQILSPYKVSRYSDIDPNPDLPSLERAFQSLKSAEYEVILAVGGGSVLDFSKIMNFILRHEKGLSALTAQVGTCRLTPLIAVPTTSGTGSESTQFSTYYVEKKKMSLDHSSLLPNAAVICSKFSLSQPPDVAASTGIDALVQAVESFWSCHSSEKSRELARAAVQRLLPHLATSVLRPNLYNRQQVAEGANFSGRAIQITRTTAAHAVSYPLTSFFGIPHGQAVGVCLLMFLRYNGLRETPDLNPPLTWAEYRDRIQELYQLLEVENGEEASRKVERLMNEIGLKTRLCDLGIEPSAFELIVHNSYTPGRMNNNPLKISEASLHKLLLSQA